MRKLIILVGFAALLFGCSDSMTENSLVGVYQIKAKNGNYRDFLKIEKKDGNYIIKEKTGNQWNSLGSATSAKKSELENFTGEKVKIDFVGLANKDVALYRMPKGWSMEKFKTRTGYWMASMIGPIELHKK